MISWTFKNKIRSADDNEFLQFWRNKDNYPQKLIYLIEQEARNRFFSNKDFNGEDDQYVHPVIMSQQKIKQRKRLINSSLALSVLLLVSGVFLLLPSSFYNTFSYPDVPVQIAQWFNGIRFVPDPAEVQPVAMMEEDKEENAVEVLPDDNKTSAPDAAPGKAVKKDIEKDIKPTVIPSDKPVKLSDSKAPDTKSEGAAKPADAHAMQPKKNVTNPPSDIEATKAKAKTTTPAEVESGKISTIVTTQGTSVESTPTPVAEQPKVVEATVSKPEPKVEPSVPKTATPGNVEDITNAQMLSNTLLREYIPFLNDWAFKQTQLPEISDYYVENNSLVNFKITKMYSDSIPAFKNEKLQMLMKNYWKNLDAELGTDFPRIAIAIKFIRFDDDL